MNNDLTLLINESKGLLHSIKYCSCNKVLKMSKECLECDVNMDKKCIDSKYISLLNKIIDFDAFKANYMMKLAIEKPIASVDCLYLHDDSNLSFIEFKLGAQAPDPENIRGKVFSSIEILIKNVVVENRDVFLKNNVSLYLVFSWDVFSIDKMNKSITSNDIKKEENIGECENKLYMSFAYLSDDLVRYSGLEYFKKYILKDVKVMFDKNFLSFISNEYWNSKVMKSIQ